MAKEVISLLNEDTQFSNKVEINENLENSLNFKGTAPLNTELRYILVPQKNTAASYVIDKKQIVSPRFFVAGIDDNNRIVEVRTIGVNTMRAMAYAFVTLGEPAPEIRVEMNENGKYRAVQGTSYVHAMSSTKFIEAADHRAIVKTTVTLVPLGARPVYRSTWDDGQMVVSDGKAVLGTENMKMFQVTDNPTEDLVKEAIKVIKEAAGQDFYDL